MFHLTPHADSENARWLSQAARLAYEHPLVQQSQCDEWGLHDFRFLDRGGEHGTQAFWAANHRVAVLAFRGSATADDWASNLDARLVAWPWSAAGARVHRGFRSAFWRAYDWLRQLTEEDRRLLRHERRQFYVTGHSRGGALAVLAAWILAVEGMRVSAVTTFGCPRVGNGAFSRQYDRMLRSVTLRYVNNNDAVPRMPCPWPCWAVRVRGRVLRIPKPVIGGYRHVGRLAYIDVDGKVHDRVSRLFAVQDALRGRCHDLGNLGPDGLNDHGIEEYVRLCDTHRV